MPGLSRSFSGPPALRFVSLALRKTRKEAHTSRQLQWRDSPHGILFLVKYYLPYKILDPLLTTNVSRGTEFEVKLDV